MGFLITLIFIALIALAVAVLSELNGIQNAIRNKEANKTTGWRSVNDELPPVDLEVIVLTDELKLGDHYKISFGHIVDAERCIDYDGWNIPGVEYWMYCPPIPGEIEQ